MLWLSILSGIASVIGCFLSFCQALKAQKSADKAEECKNMLYSKVAISDISELIEKMKQIHVMLFNYNRDVSHNGIPQGRDEHKDRADYESAIALLNTRIPLIKDEILKKKVDQVYKYLQKADMLKDIESNINHISRISRLLSEYLNKETYN